MSDTPHLPDLMVPIKKLKYYPGNARLGDLDMIKESLEYHGQYRPVVVQKSTGHILAGNHTVKAAKALGWSEVAATYVDVDDDQAARIVAVDNRANDKATYDDEALIDLLRSFDESEEGFEGTGFDSDYLEEMLEALDGEDGDEDQPEKSPQFRVMVDCETEAQQRRVFEELTADGLEATMM